MRSWRDLDLPKEVKEICEEFEPHAGKLEGPEVDRFKQRFVRYCDTHPEFDHEAVTPLFD